jgi:hypothetical protein
MRKLMFTIGAIVIAAAAIFVWSHTVLVPSQASPRLSISPADMMLIDKGPLPVEQWDAI